MSALSTPVQDDLQQQPQDPQQLQGQPSLPTDLQSPQQNIQNGDTPPVSEGTRKRTSSVLLALRAA
ncbi:hypothetical protein PHLCEN_2v2794 [Hermanssonia centrifuga]|uniref:Uncharacterized protein n=1 Tax=Hermanssonia centrifuga TaxID=98765 RepID=A0A2R6RHY7_9APHY|nr:hypothetical protein PHLCEN_2v2794 [Hermanssonia centrifuga]